VSNNTVLKQEHAKHFTGQCNNLPFIVIMCSKFHLDDLKTGNSYRHNLSPTWNSYRHNLSQTWKLEIVIDTIFHKLEIVIDTIFHKLENWK